ncbi:hypothetical protein [Luteibaculum oceani]|uniref:Uncharacterized protein n=1 Tax=Luteibaculum oceani TaxID=1294296 RepID=A0A5C6UZV7_9FLAO|nr:hypothetical protein [Luteibaculum oceani]TXC78767.1 hypothetical protein FRX97_06000 [Luteibaculum oceani]
MISEILKHIPDSIDQIKTYRNPAFRSSIHTGSKGGTFSKLAGNRLKELNPAFKTQWPKFYNQNDFFLTLKKDLNCLDDNGIPTFLKLLIRHLENNNVPNPITKKHIDETESRLKILVSLLESYKPNDSKELIWKKKNLKIAKSWYTQFHQCDETNDWLKLYKSKSHKKHSSIFICDEVEETVYTSLSENGIYKGEKEDFIKLFSLDYCKCEIEFILHFKTIADLFSLFEKLNSNRALRRKFQPSDLKNLVKNLIVDRVTVITPKSKINKPWTSTEYSKKWNEYYIEEKQGNFRLDLPTFEN